MFNSLRSQLTLLLVALLVLLSVVTGYATLSTMRQDSEEQARQILQVSTNVFRQTLQVRSDQLTESVRILAADFGFRQAVATAEQGTIQSVLENHGGRVYANLAVLFALDGRMLASTLPITNLDPLQKSFQAARSQQGAFADIISLDNEAYQIVLVPVRAPQVVAWVGMGFTVDEQLALQIQNITGLDVSFSQLSGANRNMLTTTLVPGAQQQFSAMLQNVLLGESQVLMDESENYISQAFALDQDNQLWAWLHLPNERWLSNYQQLRSQLVQIFSLGLALALVVAFFYTRSVTRPLEQLVQFATAIGKGSTVAAPEVKLAEIGMLANTLTSMRTGIYQRETQLKEQAERDSLTGLGNRLAVEKHLPRLFAMGDGQLLQINIAKFKHVNDSFGFSNGDVLLQQLASRLVLNNDITFSARLGADEFLIVLPESISDIARNVLLKQLSQPFDIAGSAISLQLIAGSYLYRQGENDVNKVLRRLDIALNSAKNKGLALALYQSGQDESHQRELTIIRDLPIALSSGQMYIVYQPKVDILAKYCNSAEALIRWQHPQLGFISPVEFILLAERSGNINLISNWMLQSVIKQLAAWQEDHPDLTVSVNLSAHDLLDEHLPQTIVEWLEEWQVPVSALSLEMTESAVMQDTVKVINNLHQLKTSGIRLAIDDFGTGQSSLAYLKSLPVHELKIDRAFIKDIENNFQDALIVKAATQLAMGLGLKVTAEGLENRSGLASVLQAGCQNVQGYYFSKPLSAEDFSLWLTSFSSQGGTFFNEV
ncbi:MAG: EAL domain-containing protein [Alishewanella sp.]|nr:EAL domain-containing protein [Alishewanella sp.]